MEINWKFKSDAKPQGSSNGFWYDILDGGYIRPELILSDKSQLKTLNNAIKVVASFEIAMELAELINEF